MTTDKNSSHSALPPRPRLVLRVGFAGSQRLISDAEWEQKTRIEIESGRNVDSGERVACTEERQRLERVLPQVLKTLGKELAGILPHIPVSSEKKQHRRVARFFAPQCPLLRLVTGLCEGSDALAASVLDSVQINPDPKANFGPETLCLETELAAVLPFDVLTYRRSRPTWFHAEFDRQLERCAWVMTLDGIYDKPDQSTHEKLPISQQAPRKALADQRRGRGYRAQSAFLLRHSDIVIAAANPDNPSRAGGTLETIREALAFGLPVVFIHTGRNDENIFLIEPEGDLHSVLAAEPLAEADWKATLHRWVTQITADPDSGFEPQEEAHGHAHQEADHFLTEFFDNADSPRYDSKGQRRTTLRERLWTFFDKRFRAGPAVKGDPKLEPFSTYRKRATDANYHYSGLYRGAFLLNYALAIAAVALAAISLTLLGTAGHTSVGSQIAKLLETAGHSATYTVSAKPEAWLLPTLLVLAGIKLLFVIGIWRNTREANGRHWNELAVDFRYLAERLRGMYYLPKIGCHQPPSAVASQFASRVIRQSAVDWLFESIVRAVSPGDLSIATPQTFSLEGGRGQLHVKKLITLQPLPQIEQVRDAWVVEQAKYHERTSRTMHALHLTLERVAVCLGWSVIVIVGFDLLLIGGKVLHWLPEWFVPFAKEATPWLIFISAVLPAVIAALGGIRFQSECQRLAERSAVMRVLLAGKRVGHHSKASNSNWSNRLSKRITKFFDAAGCVLRALIGRTPEDTEFKIEGGRWEQVDTLAQHIRADQSSPATDLGSWSHSVLRLTERVATDFVHEAAEWTVLYAKEVADPG